MYSFFFQTLHTYQLTCFFMYLSNYPLPISLSIYLCIYLLVHFFFSYLLRYPSLLKLYTRQNINKCPLLDTTIPLPFFLFIHVSFSTSVCQFTINTLLCQRKTNQGRRRQHKSKHCFSDASVHLLWQYEPFAVPKVTYSNLTQPNKVA